jgi:hypothetical protein
MQKFWQQFQTKCLLIALGRNIVGLLTAGAISCQRRVEERKHILFSTLKTLISEGLSVIFVEDSATKSLVENQWAVHTINRSTWHCDQGMQISWTVFITGLTVVFYKHY